MRAPIVIRALRDDPRAAWAGLVALLCSCLGDLVTGVTLGSLTGTLVRLPGLLVLVPAAIGMRGNVFGALGSRISTLVHQGTFSLAPRLRTGVGQSVAAAIVLSLSTAVVLAALARAISIAIGVHGSISLASFLLISVLGAVISSAIVLVVTLGVAAYCVRRRLDLDNVAAPIVTTTGDLVTVPSLFLAALLVEIRVVADVGAVVCVGVSVVALVALLRDRSLPVARRIVLESLPVLTLAATIDVVAGATMQGRFDSLLTVPALLVLLPAFLEESGALGSILSARISTKLHLGIIESPASWRAAVDDVALVVFYALPVYVALGLVADVVCTITGIASPGVADLVLVSVIGGSFATCAAVVIGFYAAVVTKRLGLDPDNHGVALVTSSLDLVGVFCLLLAVALLGLT